MLRILRAFAWMRWRIFLNSLEKTAARDAVERFSQAIEHIGPLLVMALMVPSALALSAIAGYAGYDLAASGEASMAVRIVRGLLLAGSILAIVGPLLMPVADRTNPVRLLLLPISRGTLYAAQAAGALADPWIILLVPMVLTLPFGMLIAGAPSAMLAALAAGVLALAAIVALSALTTTAIHLVLRDRRRGELAALAFVLILPLIGFIPAAMGAEHERRDRARAVQSAREQEENRPEARTVPPSLLARAAGRAFAFVPSEMYTSTIVRAVRGSRFAAAAGLGGLALAAVALHGVGLLLFGRVLGAPSTSGARRQAAAVGVWDRTIPGLSRAASAVALAHVRLVVRTPRGRSIVLSPLLMFVFFGLLTLKAGDVPFGTFRANGGVALAVFSSAVSLLSILPIAMNQFAVDGAGLTMTLLSPLSSRQLLAGKAVGNGLVAIATALLCIIVAAQVFGGGPVSAWLSLVLALVSTYTLASPAAAFFSALFPRVVDMNSIGRSSNAHGLSGLLGLAAFGLAALPSVGLVAIARLLGVSDAAPLLLLAWCAVSFGAARLMFVRVERVFESRRENMAMLM